MWWMMMLVDNFLPGGAARRSRGRSSSYSYRWKILNIGKCRRFLINLFSDPPEPPSSPRETDLPGENLPDFLVGGSKSLLSRKNYDMDIMFIIMMVTIILSTIVGRVGRPTWRWKRNDGVLVTSKTPLSPPPHPLSHILIIIVINYEDIIAALVPQKRANWIFPLCNVYV